MQYISSKKLFIFRRNIITYFLVLVALLFMLTPIIWLLSTSLKTRSEMFSLPLTLIPKKLIWSNYIKIWNEIPFFSYLKNSIIMSMYTTIVALNISSLASYSLSRFKFRYRGVFLKFILIAQLFPSLLLIIPMFIYIKKMGLLGSYTGLMICYLTFVVPFSTWSLTNFFDSIPKDLEESAMIDGCSQLGAMFHIILPVALPGIIAVSTYCFLTCWNEFIYAMIFMQSQTSWTLPVGLAALSGQFALDWGLLTAGGIIALIPAIFVMLFLQRYLIGGILAGAIKG